MLKSTRVSFFSLINCLSPNTAKPNAIKRGTRLSQSVITYRLIFTPIKSRNAPFSVAKPTLEPFGPICCTSTKRTSRVHTKNAAIKIMPKISDFLLIILNPPFIFTFINIFYQWI